MWTYLWLKEEKSGWQQTWVTDVYGQQNTQNDHYPAAKNLKIRWGTPWSNRLCWTRTTIQVWTSAQDASLWKFSSHLNISVTFKCCKYFWKLQQTSLLVMKSLLEPLKSCRKKLLFSAGKMKRERERKCHRGEGEYTRD